MEPQPPQAIVDLLAQAEQLRAGTGAKAAARQHEKGRLTARERIAQLIDPGTEFFELGLWAGWNMYQEWGGAACAGVVTGVATISDRRVMVIANDATVKAGAFFPLTAKKVLRQQRIALENRLPLIYLVDSAGVFLPLQDEVFPDEDDFGRIFRNNAIISARGIPQFAAIMGNCVAGGGYLPVLCDTLLMTEGSGLYLAGPALVKAAIGQTVSHEDLGGAAMHAAVSGTIDFREKDDPACLDRLRRLVATLPADVRRVDASIPAAQPASELFRFLSGGQRQEFDIRELIACLVDGGPFDEYKAEYGQTIVCGYARLGGLAIGVVANQRKRCKPAEGPLQYGGVIYVDSADKMARFIMDCNQSRVPLLFLQDVNGFMVGRDSEHQGIIRAGAKVVNAISNSVVPKITVVLGGSFGAGNYAMCGKAFDPRFIFAWPGSRYAVMGGEQAAGTLLDVTIGALRRQGHEPEAEELVELRRKTEASYREQMDIRYAAARLWIDGILDPMQTRAALLLAFEIASRHDDGAPFRTGVFQV